MKPIRPTESKDEIKSAMSCLLDKQFIENEHGDLNINGVSVRPFEQPAVVVSTGVFAAHRGSEEALEPTNTQLIVESVRGEMVKRIVRA